MVWGRLANQQVRQPAVYLSYRRGSALSVVTGSWKPLRPEGRGGVRGGGGWERATEERVCNLVWPVAQTRTNHLGHHILMDGWMDGWVGGVGGWVDGWMDRYI